MKAYLYFFEDYIEFIFAIAQELKARDSKLELTGLAARRRTACDEIDKRTDLPIKHYDWIGDLEQKWLSVSLDQEKLIFYEKLIGTRNMRHLITCDRELGSGFMSGGIYTRTKLRTLTNNNDEMRWRYVIGMLDYYYTTFSEEKPDFIFFNEFTMAYELGAYFIAQVLKIPCFCITFSRFGDVFILDGNPYNLFTSVGKLFEASKKDKDVLQKQYVASAVKYVEEFQSSPDVPTYSKFFQEKAYKQASLFTLLKTLSIDIMRIAAISLGLKGTKGFLRQRNGWDILKMNLNAFLQTNKVLRGIGFEEPNTYLEGNYFYYPLHVEPESSTMVLADKLTNQLTIIEQIAKSMPAGYKLLVKEHIPMLGLRPKGFYSKIRAFPDVHLISPFVDNFTLIKNAKLVVVITGTAGWEAILLSKPVLVMGHTQYNSLNQGFTHTTELVNMEEIMYKAMQIEPAKKEDLISFIAATMQEGINIPLAAFAYSHYGKDGKVEMAKYQQEISLVVDKLVKVAPSVIPAKAGIQPFSRVAMDSRLRGNDIVEDF